MTSGNSTAFGRPSRPARLGFALLVLSAAAGSALARVEAEPEAPAAQDEASATSVVARPTAQRPLPIPSQRPIQTDDPALAEALQRAEIRRRNGEWLVANRELEALLDAVRDDHGQWDLRNVAVLREMGLIQRELGNTDAALGHYREALHINRVNNGLHDVSQVALLDEVSLVHVERGEYEVADQIQRYGFYVLSRHHGTDSPEILPGLYRMAEWLRRTGDILGARALYERAINIIQNRFGADDMRLIDALSGLAITYRLERYPVRPLIPPREEDFRVSSAPPGVAQGPLFNDPERVRMNRYGTGEEALVRIVEIIGRHPESSAEERAQSLLDLGDWYIVFDKWSAAFETYAAARNVLTQAGRSDEQLDAIFGSPTPLVFPTPAPPRRPNSERRVEPREGFVDLVYDVTARGRVKGVDVTAAQPEGLMDFRTRKALKSARFRPRFAEGVPVETVGITYRHPFVYYEYVQPPDAVETAATAEGE